MIVRDEEANLSGCLDSATGMVDEIVIVDTGSTNHTMEIARRYTDQVYRYRWDDDFSAARNLALAKCRSQWILSLDADERLDCRGGDLRSLTSGADGRTAYLTPLRSRTRRFSRRLPAVPRAQAVSQPDPALIRASSRTDSY